MADGSNFVPDDLANTRLQMMAHCDEAQARFFLEAAGGNLELALQMAIETVDSSDPYGHPDRLPHQPPLGLAPGRTGARLPPRPRPPGVRGPAAAVPAAAAGGAGGAGVPTVLAAPLTLISLVLRMPLWAISFGVRIMRSSVVTGIHAATIVGDWVLPARVMRTARSAAAALANATGVGGAEELTPAGQAEAFVAAFKAAYGDRHPRWQESGWRVACQQARREFRFLFVYLHSPEHEDTESFCRQVLTCPDVVDYVNTHFVSWGGDITATDAFALSQQTQMAVSRFPHVAILTMANDNRIQLLAAASGRALSDPAALLVLLRGAVAGHGALLAAQRAETEEREFARRLVEEQDAEYEASLAADRAREAERAEERRRQEEEDQRRQEDERRAREAAEAETARQAEAVAAVERRRQSALNSLLPEASPGSEGSAAIRLRLPDGTNTARCFPAGATLQAVFDFVDSLEATTYSRYHLVANYPRRVFLRTAHRPATLHELSLVPQAALFVQPDE